MREEDLSVIHVSTSRNLYVGLGVSHTFLGPCGPLDDFFRLPMMSLVWARGVVGCALCEMLAGKVGSDARLERRFCYESGTRVLSISASWPALFAAGTRGRMQLLVHA